MKFTGFHSPKGYEEQSKRPSKKYYNRIRNLIMLLTMFELGLSTAEVIGLKWQNLNLKTGRLIFKRGKKGMKNDIVLEDDLLEILIKWRVYQARGTYYKALEYIFTDREGRQMSRFFVYYLLFLWGLNTFLPLKVVPDAPPDSGF